MDLSGEDLEDLGEPEALTRRLELERSVQFVTWKQDVIDMLLRYLNPSEEYESPDEEFCLGTASFYHAWELACKAAFGDRLSDRIDSLGFPLAGGWRARGAETLLGIIPRPEWADAAGEGCGEVRTLIPDASGSTATARTVWPSASTTRSTTRRTWSRALPRTFPAWSP